MPTVMHESDIDWRFEAGWMVIKYDDSAWYHNHFQRCAESAAVDFIVVHDSGREVWLLEAKDYTTDPPNPNKTPLWLVVTHKVRDTLAGILAGAVRASVDAERELFRRAAKAESVRVVFHCERPKHKSKLFHTLPDAADLRDKLRRSLGLVDKKLLVVDCASQTERLPWTPTWNPKRRAAP
jgi:hypothetical protein